MDVTELRRRRSTPAHVNIISGRRRIMFVVRCAKPALKYPSDRGMRLDLLPNRGRRTASRISIRWYRCPG